MNPILRDVILGLFPISLLLLFYLRRRSKRIRKYESADVPVIELSRAPIEPKWGGTDMISAGASAGIKMHQIAAGGCGVLLVAAVTYGAVVDSVARIIVLSTLLVMAIAVIAAKGFARRARQ